MELLTKRIELLQQEIVLAKKANKIISLKGIWKNINITEDELSEAKGFLFRK